MQTINLAGSWRYETDLENKGVSGEFYKRELGGSGFMLPGDACGNKVGKPYTPPEELCYEAVRTLRPAYEYIGALWLQRRFVLPMEFEDKYITLFLERVNIASDLWIDGEKIDRQIIDISAPHIYNLTGKIKAGEHTLTLRVDNSNLINIAGMASGYSVDTQSIWNGIIGRIEIQCEEIFHMSNVQVYTGDKCAEVKLTAHSDCLYPDDRREAEFEVYVEDPDGKVSKSKIYNFTLYNKKQVIRFDYPIKHPEYWDEFNPALYTIYIKMISEGKVTDEKEVIFGLRTIETAGTEFVVNGRKTALRGTLDCGIYPLTGYPPTDIETWLKTFRTVKEYGLNHVRFHAWCPPEAAFQAADMTGVYVLAEMPLWLNVDVTPLSTGDDPIHTDYFHKEARNISRFYGNHPSFVMFSNGNENLGDHELLEDITTQIKAYDPRRLYTLTSNFDRPVSPADDYFSAFEAGGRRVRVQVFHDVISEHTRLNYDEAIKNMPLPVVSFEVGQYCVYPDVNSAKDYTGNLKPANFDYIKNEMIKHNVYHMLEKFKTASGKFAALMYKEEVEASLRTHCMGGFELLGLCDYTGQGTATIGLLDVFWNSKGIISPAEFRSFCNEVVPLMKADRIFKGGDDLKVEFDLYNYGEKKINFPVFNFKVYNGASLIYSEKTRSRKLTVPLDLIIKPTTLTCKLSVDGYSNSWNIFVYPEEKYISGVSLTDGMDDKFYDIAENGGKAIVHMSKDNLNNPIEGLFKPTFWSPAHFPSERANGLMIDSKSGAFDYFPTTDYADFQWKHPIDNCICADVSELKPDFRYLVEPVPNFYSNIRRSPLFEAKVGKGSFLFTGFDFSVQHLTVQALRTSLLKYTASDAFAPVQELSLDEVKKLFK
ncbi:MAG: hypothetical protein IJG06_10070 [Clostridia bacterium]|nr:hypothetical protein [Clostridia bacterium]